jgi:hypothetical protein
MPSSSQGRGPIQIVEDVAFQVRFGRLQSAGRWILGLVLLLALAGVFGGGR